MIKVEPCKGCGSVTLVDDFMGVRLRCDPTPLDAHAAAGHLVGGSTLYRVAYLGGRPSSLGSAPPAVLGALRAEPSERPMVVAAHRCTKNPPSGAKTAQTAWKAPGVPSGPKAPPAGRTTASWAPPAGTPSAGSADHPAFEGAILGPTSSINPANLRCSGCGERCADGTYASIELGDVLVWAAHVEDCGQRDSDE